MRSDLWATPIWEETVSVDAKKLLAELTDLPPSDNFDIWNHTHDHPELSKLANEIITIAEKCTGESMILCRGWLSTQDTGQSLPPHNHKNTPLAACVYLQVPPNSGSLWLLDPRGGVNWGMESYGHIDCVKGYRIEPTVGKIVLFPGYVVHYTEANTSNFRRISLATNIEIF